MVSKEDFVTYEQAKALKELRFDWECLHGYYRFYSDKEPWLNSCGYAKNSIGSDSFSYAAPTLSLAQKWLREVKDIIIGIDFDNWNDKYECHVYKRMGYKGANIRDTYGSQLVTNEYHEDFDTYEQALSAGVDKALELLKENNNGK